MIDFVHGIGKCEIMMKMYQGVASTSQGAHIDVRDQGARNYNEENHISLARRKRRDASSSRRSEHLAGSVHRRT